MNFSNLTTTIKGALVLFTLLHLSYYSFSQQADSTRQMINLRGSVSVTNNGFSFIPSFTLGKPATVVNLSVGGKRFSFEPELRFALEGKPWSFIFIWRYKLSNTSKFQFTAGTHLPAIAFRTMQVETNGVTRNLLVSQRFLSFELSPTFSLTKNLQVGMFYLYACGIEKEATRNTHFISLSAILSNIRLSDRVFISFNPQSYI
jgi:hypothetical protein